MRGKQTNRVFRWQERSRIKRGGVQRQGQGRKRVVWDGSHVDTGPRKGGPGQWDHSDGYHLRRRSKTRGTRASKMDFFLMLTGASPAFSIFIWKKLCFRCNS